ALVPKNTEFKDIKESLSINEDIKAPINQGDVLGKLTYSLGDKILGEIELVAKDSIEKQPLLVKLLRPTKLFTFFIFLFVLWHIFVAYLRIQKRRRRRYAYRRRSSTYQFNKNLFK